jgi:hypothetical protein
MRAVRAAVGVALLVAVACGGQTSSHQTSGTDAGGTASATGGTSTGGGSGGTTAIGGTTSGGSGGGIVISDAGPPINDTGVADAAWFDCLGCACDGTTSYCYSFSGGMKQPPARVPPDPDAATCDVATEPSGNGCVLLPAECQGAPSCACLPTSLSWCNCYDDGGGLRVQCNAP